MPFKDRLKRNEYQRKWIREHPEVRRKSIAKYKKAHPKRVNAQTQAERHVPLSKVCSSCGAKDNLERHHPDYDKSLEVITLCKECHRKVHHS